MVDFADLKWSDDGLTLFFGIKSWEKKPMPSPRRMGKRKRNLKGSSSEEPEWKKAELERAGGQSRCARRWKRNRLGLILLTRRTSTSSPFRRNRHSKRKEVPGGVVARRRHTGPARQQPHGAPGHLHRQQKYALGLNKNTPHEPRGSSARGRLHDVYVIDVKTAGETRCSTTSNTPSAQVPTDGMSSTSTKNMQSYDLKDYSPLTGHSASRSSMKK